MSQHLLKLRSCVSSICELEGFINDISQRYEIGNDKYPDILISLTEAVSNAIIHGNKKDLAKFVHISMSLAAQQLVFTVTDEGKGFNPSTVPDPTAPENIQCCGGRGVFLIKELADEVHYHNNGSTVKISFRL